MVVDALSKKYGISIEKEEFNGLTGKGEIEGQKVMLVKPQTYMNLSGECVSQLLNFYKYSEEDLIVVYDDIDIEMGKIRVRSKGHAGSHNGMRNIVAMLDSENFIRIRVGTDKPEVGFDLADFVLKKLDKEEKQKIGQGVELAVKAVEEVVIHGCYSAMNLYNGIIESPSKEKERK